jgi:DNA processing protein
MRSKFETVQQPQPTQDEQRYWLALHRAPGVGAVKFRQLLAHFGSPRQLFEAGVSAWNATGLCAKLQQYLRTPAWNRVDADLNWLEHEANRLIRFTDAAYPPLLAEIHDPPALLFVHGNVESLSQPQLAIVGSRNPTAGGAALAREFAAHLTGCGLTITSGLASGVDGNAHLGALDADGISIAVTGTGLDRVYPAHHRELAYRIAEQGALVSEFPPGTAAKPGNFPRRNRIISGLALGTLVVEAALRSGSLITARTALEQGREVFAIPGSIHNPLARGCHTLIRQGAKLVETGDHILEELSALARYSFAEPEQTPNAAETPENSVALSEDYRQLLDCMGYDPVSVDQLVERCGLTPEALSSMLLLLELEGHVVSGKGGRYTRST